MLTKIASGTAIAALAMTVMVNGAFAGKGKGHRGGFDVLDFIEIEHDFEDEDDGPSCAWIRKMVKQTGSAYWKNRYREDCLDD